MDPNSQNPQGDSSAVNKLEQDLQNLKQETPATPQQPAPVVEPLQPLPQVPEDTPAAPVPSVPSPSPVEVSSPVQDVPKKGSPLMIIAIVLALVAVLAVVAYVFGAKLLSPKPTPTPVVVVVPTPTPDPTANWKNIKTKYFQVSYPNTLKVGTTNEAYLELISVNASASSQPVVIMSATDVFRNPGGCSNPYTQTKSITLDGKVLTEGTLDQNDGKTVISVTQNQIQCWFTNNGITFMLNYYGVKGSGAEFDQILSTFKFVEVTPAGSPTASPTNSPSATVTP